MGQCQMGIAKQRQMRYSEIKKIVVGIEMECARCKSKKIKKNGRKLGKQRYMCKECRKTFFDTEPKFSEETKKKAIFMYLNNVGVRKTALFIGCSRTTITNWVRKAKERLDKMLDEYEPNYSEKTDIIEMDEIYTYVQKNRKEQSYGLLILGSKSVLLHIT